jgi:alkanesulfonate monooxygenase SsuD/methylene tetrahydromethanopterin reductase-like flavin-dependent oxidoreductase (luciferase family)
MSSTTPPSNDELDTVVDIVDTLEELVGGARRLPFTPSVVVNEEEILELVDRIRVALPDDLLTARHTLDERDQILERAEHEVAEVTARTEEEATRVVREAQAQAALLVAEHVIVAEATEQARALVSDAEQHAALQRTAADDYAREVMQRLEDQLERWLGTVREGMQSLPQPPRPRGRRRKA